MTVIPCPFPVSYLINYTRSCNNYLNTLIWIPCSNANNQLSLHKSVRNKIACSVTVTNTGIMSKPLKTKGKSYVLHTDNPMGALFYHNWKKVTVNYLDSIVQSWVSFLSVQCLHNEAGESELTGFPITSTNLLVSLHLTSGSLVLARVSNLG